MILTLYQKGKAMKISTPQTDRAKAFMQMIERFRYTHGIYETFLDWLKLSASAVHQQPYHAFRLPQDDDFRDVEEQYLAIAKKYTREELNLFAEMLAMTQIALTEAKTDFLGDIYMTLDLGNQDQGQYFTPFHISDMMAQMLMGDPTEHLRQYGFVTVCEPACGGGGMLIAMAKALESKGFCAVESMFFEATDISDMCCQMTYLQTSLLGLFGIIRHGDTLRNIQWSARVTPICRLFPDRVHAFFNRIQEQTASTHTSSEEQQQELWQQLGFSF